MLESPSALNWSYIWNLSPVWDVTNSKTKQPFSLRREVILYTLSFLLILSFCVFYKADEEDRINPYDVTYLFWQVLTA